MAVKAKQAAWLRWLPVMVACGMIFIATAMPAFTGEHTETWIQKLTGLGTDSAYHLNAILRKSFHIGFFGVLGILFYAAFGKRTIVYAWLCSSAIGALDEWHQMYVPGRTPSLLDVALDSTSALLFVAVFALWKS